MCWSVRLGYCHPSQPTCNRGHALFSDPLAQGHNYLIVHKRTNIAMAQAQGNAVPCLVSPSSHRLPGWERQSTACPGGWSRSSSVSHCWELHAPSCRAAGLRVKTTQISGYLGGIPRNFCLSPSSSSQNPSYHHYQDLVFLCVLSKF